MTCRATLEPIHWNQLAVRLVPKALLILLSTNSISAEILRAPACWPWRAQLLWLGGGHRTLSSTHRQA